MDLALHPSKLYCSTAYWSHDPLTVFGTFAAFIFVICGFLFIAVCWSRIYYYYKSVFNSIKGVDAAKRKRQLAEGEQRVFIKAVALSATYATCWMGIAMKILVEFFTSNPISVSADILLGFMFLLYSLLCPVVLILFDNRVGSAVIPYLHKKVVDQVPESIIVAMNGRRKASSAVSNHSLPTPSHHGQKKDSSSPSAPNDVIFEN